MTRISLPFEEYPDDLRVAILSIDRAHSLDGIGKEAIRKITDPLGQLLFLAKKDGLAFDFSISTLAPYIHALDRRSVKNSTRETYMKGLRRLAVALNWEEADIKKIDAEINFYRKAGCSEVPEKERKLLHNPIDFVEIAKTAQYWFNEAQNSKNFRRKRSNYQRAAILALMTLAPFRVGEVRRFLVNDDLFRAQKGWFVVTELRKTGYESAPLLHPSLTPFLDALIHFGDSQKFDGLLRERWGKPLFCKDDGSMVLRETLWRHFSIGTGGHSPHIARTLTYDFFALEDDPRAIAIAQALCGHKSLRVSKDYEVYAERARFQKAQDVLSVSQKRALESSFECGIGF